MFRSGCCFTRGQGRIFYFSPGHETYPVYHQPHIQRILTNAVEWAGAVARPRFGISESPNAPTGWFERL